MRRVVTGLAAALIVGLTAAPGTAGGGGGCHTPEYIATTQRAGSEWDVLFHGSCVFPSTLQVAPGSTVTWITKDPFVHTVTSGTGLWPEAQISTESARTFAHRFNDEGVFAWYCRLHQNMGGSVIVGSPEGTPALPAPVAMPDERDAGSGAAPLTLSLVGVAAAGGAGYGIGRRRARA